MATILIIDDDPDALSILETFLEARGHATRSAGSGEEGLLILEEADPELVILDVMMPGMDGWEVARRIRRNPRHADVSILMLTARDSRQDRQAGEEVGVDRYLVKPVGLDALSGEIDALLGG